MQIDDTIQTLAGIRQSIDKWIPQTTARPDRLITDLNNLYVESAKNRDFDELFEYSDVGSPSITLTISIEVEFDFQRVTKSMRTRLHSLPPGRADEIGNAGVVWSHGRYDFVYDCDAGSLRLTHKYSHKCVDTKSVASIARQMIDYAIDYLEEVKASAKENTGVPATDDIRLPRESKAKNNRWVRCPTLCGIML
jgi:hypothetical protein